MSEKMQSIGAKLYQTAAKESKDDKSDGKDDGPVEGEVVNDKK